MENLELEGMYRELGIGEEVLRFGAGIEEELRERFAGIDAVAEYNQMKVIRGMQVNRVSDIHFAATTGYGYNDLGRDTLEDVYASVFHGESALVRPQLISGTHALHVALSGRGMSCFHRWGSLMIHWRKSLGSGIRLGPLRSMGLLTGRWICLRMGRLIMRGLKRP